MAGCLLGKNKLISSQTDHGVGDLSKYIIFLKCPPNPPQIRQQLSKTFFDGHGGCSCDGNHNDGGEGPGQWSSILGSSPKLGSGVPLSKVQYQFWN